MQRDWAKVIEHLQSYSAEVNRILPPCSEERLKAVQASLGKMPDELVDMLRQFNGAELFVKGLPLVTIFGISAVPAVAASEWAPDWYVDIYTARWRAASPKRDTQWVIGMTNYGGLIILDQDGTTKQWDTSRGVWEANQRTFDEWIQDILQEGDAFLKEE